MVVAGDGRRCRASVETTCLGSVAHAGDVAHATRQATNSKPPVRRCTGSDLTVSGAPSGRAPRHESDGVHRVARQHAAAREQPPGLPVRQPELGLIERELAVDPAGEAVADERRVDGRVEPVVLGGVVADQRRRESRAVAVEQRPRPRRRNRPRRARTRASSPTPIRRRAGRVRRQRRGASRPRCLVRRGRAPAASATTLRKLGRPRPGCSRRSSCCRPCGPASARRRRPSTAAIGVLGRNDPRSAGAVQADRHAVLAGDGAELGDRRRRTRGRRRARGAGRRTAPTRRRAPASRPAARRPPGARPLPAPARRSSA